MNKQLSTHLVSMIHHIALNEAGWWDKTIQNLIISCVWLSSEATTFQIINKFLFNEIGREIEKDILERNIEKLKKQNVLFEIKTYNYKLSEESRKKFENDLSNHEELIEKVKKYFLNQIKIYCPDLLDKNCWDSFNNELLIPMVNQLGAKTYELISGKLTTVEQNSNFQNYLENFKEQFRNALKKIIIEFFDKNNEDCREYILRMVNTFFYLEAGNLSESALQKIEKIQEKDIELNLFIDTNFLFSIMNLHDNPSNEAAISLKNLIQNIKKKVKVKFYVTNKTLEEALGVLDYHKNKLRGITLTRNIINAANKYEFSGFEKKYFEVLQKTNHTISPEDYFSPYLNNLKKIVRDNGVEFYNENYDKYSMDLNVINDIQDSLKYQVKFEKKKTYEQLLHDIMLWHFVKDKRPNYIESHLDAKYWIVTIDYRYLAFDRFKGKGNNNEINLICMHPASLIQMLQFWIPRSKEFEEAILSNIRTPFFYSEFDNDSEIMANEILKKLSRFENIADLSEDTITAILQNEALKNKIKSTQDSDEQINLIRDAIIEANNKIQHDLNKSKLEKTALQSSVLEKNAEINELKETIEILNEENKQSKVQVDSLGKRIKNIEDEKNAKKKFKQDHNNWVNKRDDFVSKKWDEYKKPKWHLPLYFIFSTFFVILTIVFINLVENQYLIYLSILLFAITQILSFVDREKIKISFHLIFRKNKRKEKMYDEFKTNFNVVEPKYENYFNESVN